LSVPSPSSVNFIDAQDTPPDDIEHVDDDTSSEVDEDFQTSHH
jgi:hypothetical protein